MPIKKKNKTKVKKKVAKKVAKKTKVKKKIISKVAKESSKELIIKTCLLYTSPSPRDRQKSRMPSSA